MTLIFNYITESLNVAFQDILDYLETKQDIKNDILGHDPQVAMWIQFFVLSFLVVERIPRQKEIVLKLNRRSLIAGGSV